MTDLSSQATRLEAIGGTYDRWLLGAALALAAIGVVMVASASVALGSDPNYYLKRHLFHLCIGVVLGVVAMRLELRWVEQYNKFLLIACFGLLLLVMLPGIGHSVNGARRWLRLGILNFQAVEAVKVLYIVWLSSYLVRFSDEVNATWMALIKPLGVVGALVGMLLLQPDFGSSVLLCAITVAMLVLAGGNLPKMAMPALGFGALLVVVAVIEPYRLRRITSFVDPWADQLGSGYQLTNALMAIGRGEWTGVGLGASIQKLNYLPEAHTDFIFSVLAEETGFLGVCVVIALLSLLIGRALWLGVQCVEQRRHFSGYVAYGVALWLGMQASISIGVNLGMLPTKGLTLPLISSGGSSVMMTCVAIGVLLRVSWEYKRALRRQSWRMAAAPVDSSEEPVMPAAAPAVQPSAAQVRASATEVAARVQHATARGTSRLQARIEPTFGEMR